MSPYKLDQGHDGDEHQNAKRYAFEDVGESQHGSLLKKRPAKGRETSGPRREPQNWRTRHCPPFASGSAKSPICVTYDSRPVHGQRQSDDCTTLRRTNAEIGVARVQPRRTTNPTGKLSPVAGFDVC